MDSSRDIVRKLRENRILQERTDYSKMDKEELIRLAREENDQLAFNTLINKNQDFFYKMTKKYVPEGTFDRDDILQIAEIAYWEALNKWDGNGDFDAFAGMVIKRRMSDELRKLDTDKQYANRNTVSTSSMEDADDMEVQGPEANKSEFDSWISQSTRSAEDEYLGDEGYNKIMEFMKNELSDAELRVILKYIDGYKVSEIAEEEDMKYKSAENAIRRAKWKIAEYLKGVNESADVSLHESIEFTDEEKSILRKVITDILGENAEE